MASYADQMAPSVEPITASARYRRSMVPLRWVNDVRHYDVTPATIEYDIDLDAFFVARADIRSPSQDHRLSLVVSVTLRDLTANQLTLQDALVRGRDLLDRLIAAHRSAVDSIGGHSIWVFDFIGARLR
jgi:hypothetical protein